MGSFHYLVTLVEEAYSSRINAERRFELEIAQYHWRRHEQLYQEMKYQPEFQRYGLHTYQPMDNLQYLEMKYEQKNSPEREERSEEKVFNPMQFHIDRYNI